MTRALLFSVAIFGWAQTGLDRPQIGLMLDARGAARPVLGLPGSSIVADPLFTGVISFGCGGFCFLKTDSSLIAPEAAVNAPAGPALFAFDASGAFVYFPLAHRLARWQSGELTLVDFQVSGEIVSLRSVDGAPEFAVRLRDETRIVRGDAVVSLLPRGARAVMLLDQAVLYSTITGVVLRRPDGSEQHFSLADARSFFRMSADYVEVRAAKGIFALRITPGKEQLFELPEPQP